jgi:hypothetical protein
VEGERVDLNAKSGCERERERREKKKERESQMMQETPSP